MCYLLNMKWYTFSRYFICIPARGRHHSFSAADGTSACISNICSAIILDGFCRTTRNHPTEKGAGSKSCTSDTDSRDSQKMQCWLRLSLDWNWEAMQNNRWVLQVALRLPLVVSLPNLSICTASCLNSFFCLKSCQPRQA